jgi:putative heme-binding domain-containing protein
MRGTLFVTDNLKEFLVKNPQPVTKITEWKIGDFNEDLKRVGQHRQFARGQQLFTTLACVQCHKLNANSVALNLSHDHGGHHSHHAAGPSVAIGPNLDDVVKKYKGDARAVLLEILEPSRQIEEKYRKITLEMEDGKVLSGNVIAEDRESVTIFTAPPAAKELKVPKDSIESRHPSAVSIMPVGQLNTLDKEQILDLLAYLLAGGDPDAAAFKHSH